jgi:hypothetical protein
VQLILPLACLGRENVTRKSMRPHDLPRPGLLESFRRTFVRLELWHELFSGKIPILAQGLHGGHEPRKFRQS